MIGKGIPQVEGTNKAHGEAGVKFADESRKAMGLPEEKFFVSPEVTAYFAELKAKIDAGIADADAGRVRPADEVFAELRARYRALAETQK